MRHHDKPFTIKSPSLKCTTEEAFNLPRSRKVEINVAGKNNKEAATKAQHAFDDPEEYQQAIESHAASYATLCEFVDKHNLRNGSDLAVDIAIDAIAKVHNIDMRSDEEKLVDELAAVIYSSFEGVDTVKKLLASYNITKKD